MDLMDETERKSPWRTVDEWDLRHRVWLDVLVARGERIPERGRGR